MEKCEIGFFENEKDSENVENPFKGFVLESIHDVQYLLQLIRPKFFFIKI